MGLITGLLTLPLAPVRGTVWLAERIQEQAENELYDEDTIREQLMQLEAMHAGGEIRTRSSPPRRTRFWSGSWPHAGSRRRRHMAESARIKDAAPDARC